MILVTGATGFIGRRLIKQLTRLKSKEEIVCLVYEKSNSELERTGRKIIKELGIPHIDVDLLTGSGLNRVPKSPNTIFHLASITDTSATDHSINDLGTKRLFESIKPLNKDTHFIFTSSIAVNDKRSNYLIPVDETTASPNRPCNEYGRKKLLTEQYLIQKSDKFGFALSIVRVCGVYGEGAMEGGLFDSIDKMVLKKSMLSRFNWPGKISLIHVEDMARFLINVSQLAPEPGQHKIYIPSVEALTLAELSKIIHSTYGLKYNAFNLPELFWKICSIFAKNKGLIQHLLPHKLYNRFWQACLLVNNEFWNKSITIDKVFFDKRPVNFKEYFCKMRSKCELKHMLVI